MDRKATTPLKIAHANARSIAPWLGLILTLVVVIKSAFTFSSSRVRWRFPASPVKLLRSSMGASSRASGLARAAPILIFSLQTPV